jgi:uncharacterized protein YbjT (DUF2867 family)
LNGAPQADEKRGGSKRPDVAPNLTYMAFMASTPVASRAAPILVTGGTGGIGVPLVKMLVAAQARVRVLTRDRARAQSVLGDGVEFVEGDLGKPDTLAPALAGCERVFFLGAAGPTLAVDAAAFAKAAKAAGVRHVVAISSGTIEMTPKVALGTWHAAMEAAFTGAGLATTFLRPDNFASNALRWAGLIRGKGMVFSSAADSQSVPIDPFDIAAVASVALTAPGHEGKVYVLSGPSVVSMREQVAIIGRELGRSLNVVEIPPEKARAGMVDNGVPPAMADAILELMGHSPRPSTAVRDVTGREPRAFAEWVHENRAAFA